MNEFDSLTRAQAAQLYIDAGFSVCAIEPPYTDAEGENKGGKSPYMSSWNKQSLTASHWESKPNDGIGVIHKLTNLCAIDIDHLEHAVTAMEAIGVNLKVLLEHEGMVRLVSGRPNRDKLIFRLPDGAGELARHAVNWPDPETGKPNCVIEFRAGLTQDVLPPSIHPDTGNPYKWIGDWRNIPEIPEILLNAWLNWGLSKEAMVSACPWVEAADSRAPDNATLKPRKVGSGQGQDVIGKFNASFHPDELLSRNGYKRMGKRWLAPGSSTKIPGVVRLPDKGSGHLMVYSFHGSDILCDEHAHDAFSLYTELEHNGRVEAAVASAAELMGLAPPPVDADTVALAQRLLKGTSDAGSAAAIARAAATTSTDSNPSEGEELVGGSEVPTNVTNLDEFVKKKENPKQVEEVAPSVGAIPVRMLEDVRVWLESQVNNPKPDAIMQTTLAFAAALTARRYVTSNGQPTTTFFGISDTSAAGLRPLRDNVYRLCSDIGERRLIRGTNIPAAHTLYSSLSKFPRMFWATDDYGTMIMRTKRQTSGAIESALSVMHELYTGNTLYIDSDTATQGGGDRQPKECDIYAPAFTMLALLGKNHVSAMTSRTEYARGTLQQMLLIPAGDGVSRDVFAAEPLPTPAGIIEWHNRIKEMKGIPGSEDGPHMPAKSTTVHWGNQVKETFSQYHQQWIRYMDTPERMDFKGMAHGYLQSAIRLSSSLAAWANPEKPVIDQHIAQWVCTWVTRCLMLSMPAIEVSSGSDDGPDTYELVMDVISESSVPMGVTEVRKRCRAFRRLSPEERKSLLETLADDGMLIRHKTSQTVKYLSAKVVK